MWLVNDKTAERIKQHPKSAVHIADDIGEMVLHEHVAAEAKRKDYNVHDVRGNVVSFAGPVHIDISMTGVGIPDTTGNEQDDVHDYFDGKRHALCVLDTGVHLFWSIVACSYGPVHAGLKHPETKKPVWYVPTMTLTCRKMEKICP